MNEQQKKDAEDTINLLKEMDYNFIRPADLILKEFADVLLLQEEEINNLKTRLDFVERVNKRNLPMR